MNALPEELLGLVIAWLADSPEPHTLCHVAAVSKDMRQAVDTGLQVANSADRTKAVQRLTRAQHPKVASHVVGVGLCQYAVSKGILYCSILGYKRHLIEQQFKLPIHVQAVSASLTHVVVLSDEGEAFRLNSPSTMRIMLPEHAASSSRRLGLR